MSIKDRQKDGIAFGVFDGLHKGHEYFLREALEICGKLKVVLTRDENVVLLKGHAPKFLFEKRSEDIKLFDPRIEVCAGDTEIGKWSIFKRPEVREEEFVVILGYDQKEIREEMDKMKIPFTVLPSYHPEKYKSSLLS